MTPVSAGGRPESAAALAEAVAVVDRLVSPGGCPWDAEQTHRSLARFLLEETYEALDAIAADDPVLLREELGDVLFQVLFHARLAEELPPHQRFDVGDVASDAVAKLTRRHPHVFADVSVSGAQEVMANWDEIKRREKKRTSATDGIALAQPALALTAKLVDRAARAGVAVADPEPDDVGGRLFALAAEATRAGVDPELALRATALRFAEAVRTAESATASPGPVTRSEPASAGSASADPASTGSASAGSASADLRSEDSGA